MWISLTAMLLYDYLLTLEDEWELVWHRGAGASAWLFAASRATAAAIIVANLLSFNALVSRCSLQYTRWLIWMCRCKSKAWLDKCQHSRAQSSCTVGSQITDTLFILLPLLLTAGSFFLDAR